ARAIGALDGLPASPIRRGSSESEVNMSTALHVGLFALLATSAWAATSIVLVGQGGLKFVDEQSQTSTTTIDPGDTVDWSWVGAFPHSTTRATAPETWDSGIKRGPARFSHTFAIDGSYDYFCTPHRALGMTGTIVVRAPSTPDEKLIVAGGRLAALKVAIDAAATVHTPFDGLLDKATSDTEAARTEATSGKTARVKAA